MENEMKDALMKDENIVVFKKVPRASVPSSKNDLIEEITGKLRREGNVYI